MPLFDHFNWIAPYYERLASPPEPGPWIEKLALPASGNLLDAGGGTGRFGMALKPYLSGEVVIADVAIGMLQQAREKKVLLASCAEAELLPFTSGSFARVMMVDAFHHVRDQAQAARELFRVLQPGGRLVVVEPDLHRLLVKGISVAEKLLLMRTHIIYPEALANFFLDLPARVQVRREGYETWVTVDKNT
jgi:ubiquinone/menaquinone biosynthesis C-methylase UbiE